MVGCASEEAHTVLAPDLPNSCFVFRKGMRIKQDNVYYSYQAAHIPYFGSKSRLT